MLAPGRLRMIAILPVVAGLPYNFFDPQGTRRLFCHPSHAHFTPHSFFHPWEMVRVFQLCASFALLFTSTLAASHSLRADLHHGDLAVRAGGGIKLYARDGSNVDSTFYRPAESGNQCVCSTVSCSKTDSCALCFRRVSCGGLFSNDAPVGVNLML